MPEVFSSDGVPDDFVARIVALHADYYTQHWGFAEQFLARVQNEALEFTGRFNPARDFLACVRSGGVLAGSITIDGPATTTGFAHLRWFIIADGLRGQGYGNRLLAAALAFCAARHYAGIYLNTFAGLDPARHLYEKSGFTLIRAEPGTSWGTPVTEQRYELTLAERG